MHFIEAIAQLGIAFREAGIEPPVITLRSREEGDRFLATVQEQMPWLVFVACTFPLTNVLPDGNWMVANVAGIPVRWPTDYSVTFTLCEERT